MSDVNEINYEAIATVDEAEGLIQEKLEYLHRQEKELAQQKQSKKDIVKGFNETIKEIVARIEEVVAVVDALRERKEIIRLSK